MIVTGVVTAPISDRIVHAGAVGYGWMNAGWGVGAFLSTFAAARVIQRFQAKPIIPACMLLLAACFYAVPFSAWIGVAAGLYLVAGAARGVGGIALSTSMMESAPKHFMGRVSTLFSIASIILQLILAPIVGRIAHNTGLTAAVFVIASLYLFAATSAWRSAALRTRQSGLTAERATPG